MEQKLPKDSLILVTGANGYIASHVIDQLLQEGYRVRGTVRDLDKSAWLQTHFHQHADKLELVLVADAKQPHAFDEAVKDISAFAHIASDMSMDTDPAVSITPTVNSVRYALQAAQSEPNCKSFVLTSSSVAAITATANQKSHIDTSTWNEAAIKLAFEEPHDATAAKRWAAYGASKALGEQAAWGFVKEHRPQFTFNTILPNANFGPVLDPKHQHGSTANWIRAVYVPGMFEKLTESIQPQWYVHPHDTAKLHVACLTDLSLNGERLLAFAEPFHWNLILGMLRKLTPDKEVPGDLDDDDRDLTTVANERALEVLKTHYGQEKWLSLEQGLRGAIEKLP